MWNERIGTVVYICVKLAVEGMAPVGRLMKS